MSAVDGIRNEADFQSRCAKLALRYELLHYHTHNSQRSDAGFPDSVFVGRTVLFRELKMTRSSRVSVHQKTWNARLLAAGADAGFWYAEDLGSGLIDEQMRDAAARTTASGRRRPALPPLSMRLAKRLYIAGADNAAAAALWWEAGVKAVDHGRWIARAHEVLALLATELPAGHAECGDWLTAHQLSTGASIGAVFQALKSDLSERADASQLLAEPHLRR